MKAFLDKVIRFLGGIPFAIILIASAALFVIAGTLFESKSGSHQYAAYKTYEHPLFVALLWGFFINILVSALRRWPFQQKHIPFLLTHCGLLMILGGALAKSYFGVQGVMIIPEGSASNSLLIPNTQAIYLEHRDQKNINKLVAETIPLSKSAKLKEMRIDLLEYYPHCREGCVSGNSDAFPSTYFAYDRGYGGYAAPLIFPIKACYWTDSLMLQLEPMMKAGKSAYDALRESGYPLLSSLKESKDCDVMLQVAQQLFEIGDKLPPIPEEVAWTSDLRSRLLTVYFQVHGSHLQSILTPDLLIPPSQKLEKEYAVEIPLRSRFEVIEPAIKWESNKPLIKLRFEKDRFVDLIELGYDPLGKGLRWPILGGQYVVRFQPLSVTMPHHVRLRKARIIHYPNSDQPYSYECDLLLKTEGKEKAVTLSMNHVYETEDQYRFYLSNISTSQGGLGYVQLVVNRDPGKRLLTYPGAVILGLGILLLWKRVCGKA